MKIKKERWLLLVIFFCSAAIVAAIVYGLILWVGGMHVFWGFIFLLIAGLAVAVPEKKYTCSRPEKKVARGY
jgi:hypothetical protein